MTSSRSRILVADEEAEYRDVLGEALRRAGYQVQVAEDGEQARKVLETAHVDLLIAELVTPGLNGLELLQAAKQRPSRIPVILMSAYGTIETAVRALRSGAYHYFQKPLDLDAVRAAVVEALNEAEPPAAVPPRTAARSDCTGEELGLVGQGPWFEHVMGVLRKLAPTRATALLTGESGTGKEVFARAIHKMSGRKGPFVAVSCGALARELLESELFGHEKGAFTGADREKLGRFELANGGTLLLDEVGDIPLDLQVKLLRVLQERQFERVGGTHSIQVDVRIIAATNQDLATAVRQGTFREDLYYRLKVVEINLPPLRERPQDIEPLARRFAKTYCHINGKTSIEIGPAALQLLMPYPWPGNVRELENAIERAVVMSDPDAKTLDSSVLPDSVRGGTPTVYSPANSPPNQLNRGRPTSSPRDREDDQDWLRAVGEALASTEGNAAAAARLLGVSPSVVRRWADRHGLERRRAASSSP